MATADFTRDLRRAVITALKADAALTALVPAAQIHTSTVPANPAWPFLRWDAPNSIPRGVACTQGAEVTFFVHAFAKAAATDTAEAHAERITAAVAKVLHRARLTLPSASARLRVRATRSMMDGAEKDAWHGIVDVIAGVTIA